MIKKMAALSAVSLLIGSLTLCTGFAFSDVDARQATINENIPNETSHANEITVTIDKINDDVNKVTLSRGQKLNAGYGMDINTIHFESNGQAVITYTLRNPQPDEAYAEVITEAKVVTYLSSKYKPVAEQAVAQVPAPAPSLADSISEMMNKQIKELFELVKKGKVPDVAFAVHTNRIDEVRQAWGPADTQKSLGNGLIYDSFNVKHTVIGYNKGSQIFEIQSSLPAIQKWNIQRIELMLGKPTDTKVGQDSSIYIYAANDQFQLKLVVMNATGYVDHLSVLSPKDAVDIMEQIN
ncbi:hypothetical protein A8709_18790 [Paenibacillus pectinilyticus]|uniref:PrcB C-terminal domain-containing protein n=1 Tax=Paenibacillus pectinilyticus TaxID=512399 RepID=A0A1C0ZZT6_9BACL|nr:YjgB family protein [Paenibacillus pectinilyticus]OCT13638.1 hypothetical protein A8709_18790 [Paenibacillus pectinilyticus]